MALPNTCHRHPSKCDGEPPENAASTNPSGWGRRCAILFLAVVDFLLATYLALYQWGLFEQVLDPVFGAGSPRVLHSELSLAFRQVFGVPDAAVGAAAYLAECVLTMVGSRDRWRTHPWLVVAFGLNAAALMLVGAGLVVVQATVVHAWCLLCLFTAALSLAMFLLAVPELTASIRRIYCRHRVAKTTR